VGCEFRQEQARACSRLKDVLVDSEGSYFRFKGSARDSEFRRCANRPAILPFDSAKAATMISFS